MGTWKEATLARRREAAADPARESLDVAAAQARIREFVEARDWSRFHNPKNLTMALAGEVGELMEHFQWLDATESDRVCDDSETFAGVKDEIADVLYYTLRIADVLGVDLASAFEAKMLKNEQKYPLSTVVAPPGSTR